MARVLPAYAGVEVQGSSRGGRVIGPPRIRGGRGPGTPCSSRIPESSPHTRGSRVFGDDFRRYGAVLPAYAGVEGATRAAAAAGLRPPRIRGGRGLKRASWIEWSASSPHTRGSRLAPSSKAMLDLVLPAYAGVEARRRSLTAVTGCPPRIRGGRGDQDNSRSLRLSSSPHTRGSRPPSRCRSPDREVLPAYAGVEDRDRRGPRGAGVLPAYAGVEVPSRRWH
ncbi:hypothetical protein SAMN05421595_0120 [Austwickia chelonae]|nr:hypothetical protein SAMN05421595_0120 [Austwickia chelonae]